MKKIVFLFSAVFTLLSSFAQDGKPTSDDYERFFKTKTLIVLQDNPMLSYNFEIKDVIAKEWTLTEYDFIEAKDFEAKRMDPQYSFLVVLIDDFQRDKTKAQYKFLHLMMGGDYFRINQMPDLVSIPLAYSNVEEDTYDYKLNSMVRFMQNHVQLIHKNPQYIGQNSFKYYKDNMETIQDKTLYLVPEELDKSINTESKIKKIYPYPFKLVSREDVKQSILNREPNVVYLHKVGPEGTKLNARCYKILLAADVPVLFYFDYHMIDDKRPDGFLDKDLKNLAKGKTFLMF